MLARALESLVAVTIGEMKYVGSGVVLGHAENASYILTCAHVVKRKSAGAITYRLPDMSVKGCSFLVVKKDKDADLALLMTSQRLPVPAMKLATLEPHLYQCAVVAGCPAPEGDAEAEVYFGTACDCRITGMNGSNGHIRKNYQLSIPIGTGMSGGMLLVDGAGEYVMVGVPDSGDDKMFVSFCTPLPVIKEFLKDVMVKL